VLSHSQFTRLLLCASFTLAFVLVLTGCASSTGIISNPTKKDLKSIAVSPASGSVTAGSKLQLGVSATYSDGSVVKVTSGVTWSSSAAAIATVDSGGDVTAVAPGSATITAAFQGVSGSATLTIKAPTVTLSSIAISPAPATVQAGATLQLTATGTYSDGSTGDITSQAAWTSADKTIATVDSSGKVTGVAAGSASITAIFQGVSASTTLQVTTATVTLSSITVSPSTASVQVGASQQFTATGTYSDGSTGDVTSQATWSSADKTIATVDAKGNVTAVAAGSTNISATFQGMSASATLKVTAATVTLSSISVTPATASVQAGSALQFTATGTYSDGSTGDITSQATWTSADTTIATIDAKGNASGVAEGSTTITASYQGGSGSATLKVTAAKTLSSIVVSPSNPTVQAGATQQFTATGTYSDGSTADITSQTAWTSADTTVLTVDAKGLATGVAAGSTTVGAALNNVTGSASVTVTQAAPQSIAITPASPQFAIGGAQQLTATATNNDGSTRDVSSSVTWTVANTAVASVNASGLLTGIAAGSTKVSASLNGTTASQPIEVTTPPNSLVNISTWHVDNNRSGLNSGEISLAPSNVSSDQFGKLFSDQVDGYVYGSPLVISNVNIQGATHNVLYVATENDSVYAFDSDQAGDPLWKVSLLKSGESPLTAGPIQPVEGITSTPVIDRSTGTLYVVSTQKAASAGGTFRLNALDITTGAQKFGGPVTLQASVPGTGKGSVNGMVSLSTSCTQRSALLLANNTIYIGFGSCAKGWLLAYDATSLAQVGAFNSSPNLDGEGKYASAGGIWMGGAGPAADNSGNVYVVTGNGPWDGKTAFSDSVLKFDPKLNLLDYFTPADYQFLNCADSDLASGGLLLLPGTSEALAGGKEGKLFLVDTNNMGKERAGDTGATQTLWFGSGITTPFQNSCTDASGTHNALSNTFEIFGTSAWFDGSTYVGVTPTSSGGPAGVRQFTYSGTLAPGPDSAPGIQQNTRGTSPFISSNGSSAGILWMIDTGQPIQNSGGNTPTNAILRAYDASQYPRELYSSSTNSGDQAGYGIKFSSPVVANGKAYISTGHNLPTDANPQGEIDVYGLK
jgi:uncharacterized protein YjdB